jgi:hypothetical protein
MSRVNPAEMSGSIGALGIIIEKPNLTVSEVAQELDRRFPRCRFASSTAYSALPQMARGGHLRARVRCTYREAPGVEGALDRYEATREGLQAFRSWMYEQPSGAPTLRDALYGRIELCHLPDLPHLVRIAEEEALVAADLYSAATTKLKEHRERRDGASNDHLRMVREVLLYVDPMHWSSRHNRYEEIARRLREIAGEAGVELFEALDG